MRGDLDRPLRILHVLPTRASHYGGPIRIAEALVKELVRAGHAAEIFPAVSSNHDGRHFGYWPGATQLRSLAAKVRAADLVHVHGLWTIPTSAAAHWARVARRPYVIQPHGMLDHWSLRRSALKKKIYAVVIERTNLDAAAAVHFYHQEERDEAQAFGIRVPCYLLPNGVDQAAFSGLPDREALLRKYPEVAQKTVILFLGRIHPKKGIPLLLDALAQTLAHGHELHLFIAGPDEAGHRAEVETQVRRLSLTPNVTLTGPVDGEDKRLLLGGADLFALTSHQEGDSVAVKEALGAGLPVLITHPCHLGQAASERAGLVVNPVVGEIQIALEKMVSDATLRAEMSANARRLVERDYRWDAIGAKLVERYKEVLARYHGGTVH
jgi:glycosyltransferase involved in cell wall biosynthesis